MTSKISRAIRVSIVQTLKREGIFFGGVLTDTDFLSRIYDLDKMESKDPRYESALGDIHTHRYAFPDWGDDWVFNDDRFNLMECTDEEFFRFLCETIHTIVRPDEQERKNLLELYNKEITKAGYEIEEKESAFGNKYYHPAGIFEQTIPTLKDIQDIGSELNSDNNRKYVTRMMTNIEKDPELVIGTAKDWIESIFKTFLKTKKIEYSEDGNLPKLATLVFNEIREISDEKNEAKSNEITRQMLRVLSTLVQNIAELRNNYGSGHGKESEKLQLGPIYASLAANAAATLVMYTIQTHEKYFKNNN